MDIKFHFFFLLTCFAGNEYNRPEMIQNKEPGVWRAYNEWRVDKKIANTLCVTYFQIN